MKKIYRIFAIIFIIIMILSIISLLFWHFHNNRVKEIVREEKTHLKLEEETYQLEETILEDNSNIDFKQEKRPQNLVFRINSANFVAQIDKRTGECC